MRNFRDMDVKWFHNAHLRKTLSFCQISDLKNTHRDNFFPIFLFYIYHLISGLEFENTKYYTISQNCVYFIGEKFQKPTSKAQVSFVNVALASVSPNMYKVACKIK